MSVGIKVTKEHVDKMKILTHHAYSLSIGDVFRQGEMSYNGIVTNKRYHYEYGTPLISTIRAEFGNYRLELTDAYVEMKEIIHLYERGHFELYMSVSALSSLDGYSGAIECRERFEDIGCGMLFALQVVSIAVVVFIGTGALILRSLTGG